MIHGGSLVKRIQITLPNPLEIEENVTWNGQTDFCYCKDWSTKNSRIQNLSSSPVHYFIISKHRSRQWVTFEANLKIDACLEYKVKCMSASMLKQNLKNYQTNTMVETKQKNCYPIPNKVKICKQMIFIMTIPSQSTKYILKVYLYYINI